MCEKHQRLLERIARPTHLSPNSLQSLSEIQNLLDTLDFYLLISATCFWANNLIQRWGTGIMSGELGHILGVRQQETKQESYKQTEEIFRNLEA